MELDFPPSVLDRFEHPNISLECFSYHNISNFNARRWSHFSEPPLAYVVAAVCRVLR